MAGFLLPLTVLRLAELVQTTEEAKQSCRQESFCQAEASGKWSTCTNSTSSFQLPDHSAGSETMGRFTWRGKILRDLSFNTRVFRMAVDVK